MKKVIKIFAYFIGVFLVLIIVLMLIAKLSENKIADIAMRKVSESIDAPVEIEEVSFNLLRKFPLASIELHNVLLGSPKGERDSALNADVLDTIVSINKIFVSVKSKALLNGEIDIKKVDIDGGIINYKVDTNGTSNIDFLITASDSTEVDTVSSEPLNLTLTDFSVNEIICNYHDESIKANARVFIPELNVDAKMLGENINASAKGIVSLSQCGFDDTNLHLMENLNVTFNVDYNIDSLSIKELLVNTEGASLDIIGSIVLGEEVNTDIQFNGTNLIVDELIKYAPKKVLDEFGIQKLMGVLNINATVKGSYSENEFPEVKMELDLQNGNILTNDYPEIKNLAFKGDITNGILRSNKSTQAIFETFYFETDKSNFDFEFSVLDIDHLKYNVSANLDINVADFKDFIPDSLVNIISGNVKANLSTKGELPDSIGDEFIDFVMANSKANVQFKDFNVDIDSTLSVKNFSALIEYEPNYFAISNLNIDIPLYNLDLKNTYFKSNFNGSINDLSKMSINLKSYYIETKGAEISGFLKVKNLENPSYETKTRIALNLEDTKSMLPDSLLKSLSGKIIADINSKATLNIDSIQDQIMDVAFLQTAVDVDIQNFNVELPDDSLYKIENLSGKISMKPEVLNVSNLKGIAAGIEFVIDSTIVENIYNTVVKNQKEQLTVNTRIGLGDLNYDMFTPFLVTDSTQVKEESEENRESETESSMNFSMLLKGAVKINSVKYNKVLIEDISTLFSVSDSIYIADQFKFNAFGGTMNSSVRYRIKSNNKSEIQVHNKVDKMNIKQLLADFDDFADYYEPSITHENLSGLFSTDLYSKIPLVGDSIIQKNIRVKGNFKLEEGGVYDFEPATNLSKFTGIDQLDNIKFKTLDSRIFIFKNAIFLPETFISSTALNIKALGMQSFADDFEYHLEVKLRDIILGKTNKQKRKEKKAGDEDFEDNRNMRELFYSKTEGKTKYGFDDEVSKQNMINRIEAQERLFKVRFGTGEFNFETGVYKKK